MGSRNDGELAREQQYVTAAYGIAAARAEDLHNQSQGANQRAAVVVRQHREDRASELLQALSPDMLFVMGRVDLDDELSALHGERLYVGRCLVLDPITRDELVVNWKTEAAGLWYRSNARQAPEGVTRKRTFTGTGPHLTSLDDVEYRSSPSSTEVPPAAKRRDPARRPQQERRHGQSRRGRQADAGPAVTGRSAPVDRPDRPPPVGERTADSAPRPDPGFVEAIGHTGDPLLEELARSSGTAMRDIVRTIQDEQYRLMEAPLDRHLVIQGGPGTGKTAVGLHRVALQLHRHQGTLRPESVLVVGPSETFLRYVASVLPSLGEQGVNHAVLASVGPRPNRVRVRDDPDVARIKGSPRMAKVIAAFLTSRVTPPEEDLVLGDGLRLTRAHARRVVTDARRRTTTHSSGRQAVREGWIRRLARTTGRSIEDVQSRLGSEFENALDRVWPTMSATEAVNDLLSGPRLLTAAADGLLRPHEITLLQRPRSRRVQDIPWTVEDTPLIDEAEELLTGPPRRQYAHVVVDEAQNLSSMEWRMLARRARGGTFTLLGDLAQTTRPVEGTSWEERLTGTALSTFHLEKLSAGYRSEDAVMQWANRLLWAMNIDLPHVRSVRRAGDPPMVVEAAQEQLPTRTVEAVTALSDDRRVGLIAPPALLPSVEAQLAASGVSFARVGTEGVRDVVVAGPAESHGLEFDELVVVEPTAILVAEGVEQLYVALTRTRGSLSVVHSEPLPPVLRGERLDVPDVAGPVFV